MQDSQQILDYAKPANPPSAFALRPEWMIVLVAVIVPGLSSFLIRGQSGWRTFVGLCATVATAFLFFGPIWGEVLFARTRWSEAGLYPFLFTCAAVAVISAILALRDRRRALERWTDHH